ncbi:unnamed protein product [Heterobilharzia americana]|nr:unnamed protein product [Heterobilharzia americana]
MLLRLCSRLPFFQTYRYLNKTTEISKRIDRFNGIHLNIISYENNDLHNIIQYINDIINDPPGFKAIWVTLKSEHCELVPALCRPYPLGPGFKFHHAYNSEATLVRWLGEGVSRLPDYASHQVGVAGVLTNSDTSKVLMVREKGSPTFSGWKFPTGLLHAGEDIADAAVREVYEECGIHTDFGGVISFRQQHDFPGSFGISDLLFTCRLQLPNGVSEPEIKTCSYEIADCKWMPLSKLLSANVHTIISTNESNSFNHDNEIHITSFTQKIIHLIMITSHHSIDLSSSELTPHRESSIIKGKFYDLFLPRYFNSNR